MKKMNKKGFTLVEMLVVIAIIAVLVSIIIPTVTSSTDKAKAAADAANLRSAQAVVSIGMLDGKYDAGDTLSADDLGIPATGKTGGTFSGSISTDGKISLSYGSLDIDALSTWAETGTAPTTGNN